MYCELSSDQWLLSETIYSGGDLRTFERISKLAKEYQEACDEQSKKDVKKGKPSKKLTSMPFKNCEHGKS